MNHTDTLGYNFEMSNIECLKGNGYGKYIKFANPSNPHAWKRKREIGVDMVIQLGEHTYYVEESFCSYSYKLSQSWFDACRLPRFRDYPSDTYHHQIILTNFAENFSGCSSGAITIVTISWLLYTICCYTDTTTGLIPDNTNGYDKRLEVLIVKPSIVVNHPCQIGHPQHEEWLARQIELAEKYEE